MIYDAAIIGSGPAGLSAALVLKIHEKNFMWFGSKNLSDKIDRAEMVNNYPGLPAISGKALNQAFQDSVKSMDLKIEEQMVNQIMALGDSYAVMAGSDFYEAKSVILATGVAAVGTLPGEAELVGKGVSYCATCDGEFYKGKTIAVICNKARFEYEVKYLADLAAKVYYLPLYKDVAIKQDNIEVMKVQSQFSSAGAATEMTEGFSFYKWMKAFDENFDAAYGDFVRICERVQNETFDANHLVVSVASKRDEDDVSEIADVFSKNKPAKVPESKAVHYSNAPQREAIQIPGGISYAVSAGNLHRLGYAYSSEMDVLSTILSFDYLWNEVRVKGGAYGCGFSAGAGGGIGFSSYRDPDPLNSIDVYNNAAAYIERFCKDEEPLDKYVISTAASQEPLKQARILAEYADTDYFRGIRYEDRVEMRRHILQMKKSDLLKYADLMNRVSQQKAYCVVGNEQAIAKCRDEGWTVESL